ncbi:hypothetical protein ANTRET_LOCUS7430 [Anthophora retusa]
MSEKSFRQKMQRYSLFSVYPPMYPQWRTLWEKALTWKISALNYTAATLICLAWMADWKPVCKYIPYYGSKYKAGSPKDYFFVAK